MWFQKKIVDRESSGVLYTRLNQIESNDWHSQNDDLFLDARRSHFSLFSVSAHRKLLRIDNESTLLLSFEIL